MACIMIYLRCSLNATGAAFFQIRYNNAIQVVNNIPMYRYSCCCDTRKITTKQRVAISKRRKLNPPEIPYDNPSRKIQAEIKNRGGMWGSSSQRPSLFSLIDFRCILQHMKIKYLMKYLSTIWVQSRSCMLRSPRLCLLSGELQHSHPEFCAVVVLQSTNCAWNNLRFSARTTHRHIIANSHENTKIVGIAASTSSLKAITTSATITKLLAPGKALHWP